MLKRIWKRYLSLTLALVMALSLLPGGIMTAYAAETLSGLTVDDLSVEYTNGTWNASGTTINGSATGEDGMCSNSATTSTLVLTNKKTSTAKLMFNYTVTLNSGSVTVGGTSVSSDGTYSYSGDIEDDGTLQIVLTSGEGSSYTTSITITDIYLLVEQDVTTTFAAAENGSYTVNGTEITNSTAYTQSSTTAYSLVATPADGYQFLGWYSTTDGKYLSTSASTSLYVSSDQTVTAVFGSASTAVFETGGGRFTDLNEAVTYAQKMSASIITLVADGSLPAGSYAIPSGIVLLIPFDEAGTCYTTEPGVVSNSNTTPTAYRTLTMEDGASIEVYGGISVSAKVSSAGGSAQHGGSPSGSSGRIVMNSGSSITVKDGGSIYAWGFITGPLSGDKLSRGTITAESGATVYECFQITDFRGGSATSTCVGSVFPFSQWYVQNIEVPLTLCSGATENVFTALYAGGSTYTASFTLIAQNSGMFQLTDSGTTLVKSYDPTTDRLTIDVNGDAKVGGISMTVAGVSIESSDYILPVNSNITLNINSGTTTASQDIKLLPGVQVTVASGATLDISSGYKAIVYDSSDWVGNTFVLTSYDLRAVKYTPTRSYTRTSSNLTDVTVDVNGTISVSGALYTTSGGAAITSSQGSGKVVWKTSAPSSTTISEMTANSTVTTVSVTSAQLLNGDGSYTATEGATADTTYTYNKSEGKWVTACTEHTAGEAVIENEVAATCTESGSYDSVVYCTVCGEEISRETIIVAATDHSYEAVVTAPTCTEQGYTTYTCSVCGDSYVDDYTEATGHSYTSEVTKVATCTEDGVTTYTCSVCGDTYTEAIAATGHTWDEGEVTTSATCTDEGVMTYTCTVCGETKTEAISATGHTAVVDAAVAATCTETGLTEGSHCSVCGAVIVEQEVIPALGHDYVAVVTAPTCTEQGYTTYTCSRCGDSYVDDYTAALGHAYTGVVTKEATCTEDGVMTYTCSVCGDTYTETISATGHSYEAVVTAPTCTEQGYTTYTCSVCGDSYVSNYVDALGHSYDEGVVTREATCTEDGVMTYTCTVCGETKTEAIAATGHSHVGEVTTPATCTEDGVMTYTCTKCGDSYTETIPATGHTVVTDEAVAATCTTPGLTEGSHCSVCGEVLVAQEEIPATGHSYEVSVTTPSDTVQCVATYTCAACGDTYTEYITGLYDIGDDTYYLDENSYAVSGLVRIVKDDGEVNYYYFRAEGDDEVNTDKGFSGAIYTAVKNVPESGSNYWITKTNGLLPEWGYYFDENGVILHDEDT
ncbi:MAG: hypothetical protein LUH41_04450, partial [Clostridiales bacterium]|nr:hypothetical protein [Clostridiales bacterium]